MAQGSNRSQTALPVFLVAGSNQGLAGTYASGAITLATFAQIADAQTLTLDDGINPATVFEFDKAGNGVSGSNVAIDMSGDTTAAEVAATTLAVINATSGLNLFATISTATLTLTNTVKGDAGNVTTWASSNSTINGTIVQPTGGEGNLVGSGDAFGIADRQLGIVAAGSNGAVRDNDFISSGDTVARVPAVSIVQGTPYSQTLSEISAFGHTHKAVVKTAALSKANVRSVSTRKYELGRYELDYITGVGTPIVGERYALTVTIDGARTGITHGENREVLQSTVEIPTGSNTATYLLEQLAIKFNNDYSKFAGNGGNFPVVALGIGTGGTVIGTRVSGNTLTFQNTGTARTLTLDQKMIHSLNTAIGNVSGLSTATVNTMTGSATLTGLLIVVMHEKTLEVIDTVQNLAASSEVTLGATDFATATLANTVTKVSTGYTGTNTGRQVSLEFDRRARQLAFSLENYVNSNEYPLRAPTYVDANAEGYNVTVIEAVNDNGNKPMALPNDHYQQVFIALPAAVSNPSADADTGYTVATTQTATVTALNTDLTPWLASTDAQFKGEATSTAVFV